LRERKLLVGPSMPDRSKGMGQILQVEGRWAWGHRPTLRKKFTVMKTPAKGGGPWRRPRPTQGSNTIKDEEWELRIHFNITTATFSFSHHGWRKLRERLDKIQERKKIRCFGSNFSTRNCVVMANLYPEDYYLWDVKRCSPVSVYRRFE
jgi:hypothetical protein